MGSTRTEQARRRILDAALDVFVQRGYLGATTDEIVAAASASKQTVYRHFGDKEGLFRAIVADVVEQVAGDISIVDPDDFDDGPAFVHAMARQLASSVLSPRVQRIRRLVIAEAGRFPDVGRAYYDGAFKLVLARVGAGLDRAAARGWLHIEDPTIAANHLAGLTLWLPTNHSMMTGLHDAVPPDEIDRAVHAGAAAFLAAYAP